ncbi:primosomal replication protein N'' [Erwinia persicina]|jgi:primosomal replication protein N''|uniref:Primosomal replication protein PriC n=1 Tax=Erwinia plantamica TaxID=3237104 RepID=A0ABW7CJC4_9GAMM|nr:MULTISPECIES: primosomal replication protein [Erwinia]MCP1437847.1 primosomal replication protein N'' [Erwinia persicina]MDN4628045.1 primosomal replication protein [Erwinia sp. PsM31]
MKSAHLLEQLEAKLEELAQTIAPHANQRTAKARFDSQLFHCHGTRLADYLQEARQSMALLRQSVNGHRTERVAWMAERVVLQISALQRELATLKLRNSETRPEPEPENLYEKLAKHQDYERRLRAMVADRESQLAHQETLAQQRKLQQEIAALEGRLQRCLLALKKIERAIENRDRQ